MTDTLLHIVLGIALFNAFKACELLLGPTLAAGAIAAFWLFTREVTQAQDKHFDSDFRKGWDFWNWSASKNLETWIPVASVIAIAVCVQLTVQ